MRSSRKALVVVVLEHRAHQPVSTPTDTHKGKALLDELELAEDSKGVPGFALDPNDTLRRRIGDER